MHKLTRSEVRKIFNDNLTYTHNGRTYDLRGWKLTFNNNKSRLGVCRVRKREISISLNYMYDGYVQDTVLHELAHAFDYLERGTSNHDYNWRKWCRRIGANPTRTTNVPPELRPDYKWFLRCPTCGRKTGYYRKPKLNKACAKCCNGRYNEKHKLQLIRA